MRIAIRLGTAIGICRKGMNSLILIVNESVEYSSLQARG